MALVVPDILGRYVLSGTVYMFLGSVAVASKPKSELITWFYKWNDLVHTV